MTEIETETAEQAELTNLVEVLGTEEAQDAVEHSELPLFLDNLGGR